MKFLIRDENKYEILYFTIVFFMLSAPFLEGIKSPLIPLLFLLVILSVLSVLNLKKKTYLLFLALAITAFISEFISVRTFPQVTGDVAFFLKNISLIANIGFLAGAIRILLIKIFSEKAVTRDTIKGGIAVYFLIGIFWALLYTVLLIFDPRSLPLAQPVLFIDLLYFSFTTLSTLGYGDISPLSGFARNFAVLEAIVGQLYIAILVARLVGLHLMRFSRDK